MIGQGFAIDAHRMRGVISLCFALSPVESYRLFPWQVSSRLLCTPMFCRMQEEFSAGNFAALDLRKKGLEKIRPSMAQLSFHKLLLR